MKICGHFDHISFGGLGQRAGVIQSFLSRLHDDQFGAPGKDDRDDEVT